VSHGHGGDRKSGGGNGWVGGRKKVQKAHEGVEGEIGVFSGKGSSRRTGVSRGMANSINAMMRGALGGGGQKKGVGGKNLIRSEEETRQARGKSLTGSQKGFAEKGGGKGNLQADGHTWGGGKAVYELKPQEKTVDGFVDLSLLYNKLE